MSAVAMDGPALRTRPRRPALATVHPAHPAPPVPPVTPVPPRRPRLLLPPTADHRTPDPLAEVALLPPALRSVGSPAVEAAWPTAPRSAARPPGRPEPLPDPERICGAIVLAAVEAITGARPLVQLTRWVAPAVLEAVAARVLPATDGGRGTRRATVRRIRVCPVSPRVVEASVVVHDGFRVRAAAVRLEAHRGQWRATVLQIG